jgi:hypothetical protein
MKSQSETDVTLEGGYRETNLRVDLAACFYLSFHFLVVAPPNP